MARFPKRQGADWRRQVEGYQAWRRQNGFDGMGLPMRERNHRLSNKQPQLWHLMLMLGVLAMEFQPVLSKAPSEPQRESEAKQKRGAVARQDREELILNPQRRTVFAAPDLYDPDEGEFIPGRFGKIRFETFSRYRNLERQRVDVVDLFARAPHQVSDWVGEYLSFSSLDALWVQFNRVFATAKSDSDCQLLLRAFSRDLFSDEPSAVQGVFMVMNELSKGQGKTIPKKYFLEEAKKHFDLKSFQGYQPWLVSTIKNRELELFLFLVDQGFDYDVLFVRQDEWYDYDFFMAVFRHVKRGKDLSRLFVDSLREDRADDFRFILDEARSKDRDYFFWESFFNLRGSTSLQGLYSPIELAIAYGSPEQVTHLFSMKQLVVRSFPTRVRLGHSKKLLDIAIARGDDMFWALVVGFSRYRINFSTETENIIILLKFFRELLYFNFSMDYLNATLLNSGWILCGLILAIGLCAVGLICCFKFDGADQVLEKSIDEFLEELCDAIEKQCNFSAALSQEFQAYLRENSFLSDLGTDSPYLEACSMTYPLFPFAFVMKNGQSYTLDHDVLLWLCRRGNLEGSRLDFNSFKTLRLNVNLLQHIIQKIETDIKGDQKLEETKKVLFLQELGEIKAKLPSVFAASPLQDPDTGSLLKRAWIWPDGVSHSEPGTDGYRNFALEGVVEAEQKLSAQVAASSGTQVAGSSDEAQYLNQSGESDTAPIYRP